MDAFQKLQLNQMMDKVGRFKLPAQAKENNIFNQTEEKPSISLENFFSE
jgi:hypothetical protein